LSDVTLLRALQALVARDCSTTAELLLHVSEVEVRKLYLPAGYPSMFAYCVEKLRMSEDVACKRIRVGRAAREFPAILQLVADGCLSLSAAVVLAPHLTASNAEDLLSRAVHKTKAQVEQLGVDRLPRPDLPARLRPLGPSPFQVLSPDPMFQDVEAAAASPTGSSAPGRIENSAEPLPATAPATRFSLQVTISQAAHDDLRRAQDLLSHQITGDIAQVLERALRLLVVELERRKCAATSKPRVSGESRAGQDARRCVPAHVRRAVWRRDQGQCTYVSETGHRCSARSRLELDHVHEASRGGPSTISNLRLRCRAHNQYTAERT